MPTVRRLYLYVMAFVGLEVVLWGSISLIDNIFDKSTKGVNSTELAGAIALVLVGVPVFVFHWVVAQRMATRDIEERSGRVRAVFLYGVLPATLIPAFQNAVVLLERLLSLAFRVSPDQAVFVSGRTWGAQILVIGVNLIAAIYFSYVIRVDWSTGPAGEAFPETRRLYRYLLQLYSLALVIGGSQQILQGLLSVGGQVPVLHFFSNGLPMIIVGLPVWLIAQRTVRMSLVDQSERDSSIRLTVLYLLIFTSATVFMIATGLTLYQAFRWIIGIGKEIVEFQVIIAGALSAGICFGAVWLYYWRILRSDLDYLARNQTEKGERGHIQGSSLRRVYFYVLAFIGLVGVFIGINMLIESLIELYFGVNFSSGIAVRDIIALSLAAVVVGMPVWILAWVPMVRESRREGEEGDYARRSIVRKSYLYLILLIGVIGGMISAGAILFQIINSIIGKPVDGWLVEVWKQVTGLLIFIALVVYHWLVLQGDNRLAERSLTRIHAQFPVLVLIPDEGDFGDRMTNALQRQAPGLPVAVHAYSQGAPDETLSSARAVILTSELVTRPSEAIRVWLSGFTGIRLVVPTATEGWHIILGEDKSIDAVIRQTARDVRQLAEEGEIYPPRGSSAWLMFFYILSGVFGFIILTWMISLIVSLFLSQLGLD